MSRRDAPTEGRQLDVGCASAAALRTRGARHLGPSHDEPIIGEGDEPIVPAVEPSKTL
jgi:hypothetical protein